MPAAMTAGRLALAPLVTATLMLMGAQLGLATEPEADFAVVPAVPEPGEAVTFTPTASDPDGGSIESIEWSFGDGVSVAVDSPADQPVQHAYGSPGEKIVTIVVTDSGGESVIVDRTFRVNAAPAAGFGFAPAVPNVGESVAFDATATTDDFELPAEGYDWDLDGDGAFDDARGRSVSGAFPAAGDRAVALRVTDADGATATATRTIHVNHPPAADFTLAPRSPRAGDAVDFVSISSDPESPIASEAWDLDDDGQFDDASGKAVSRSFASARRYNVRLRVTDPQGASAVRTIAVDVRARPAEPPPELEQLGAFVRIVGLPVRRGRTRIAVLSVRARRGAKVRARCRGRHCPRKRPVRRRSAGKTLRLRALERRVGPGARISIEVTYPGRIGKYTSFTIRRGKRPQRRDLCLIPGRTRPSPCPV